MSLEDYPSIELPLPDGTRLKAVAIDDENFPAINLYWDRNTDDPQAVVTWYDSQTGQFRYKDKCETCGQVASGEHSGGLFVGEGLSYNAGFTCTNSDCSMWGKPQRAIISCSTSGEWIEVDD